MEHRHYGVTLLMYFLNAGNISHREVLCHFQRALWATAEKPIFKYMKYAMQHEKQK